MRSHRQLFFTFFLKLYDSYLVKVTPKCFLQFLWLSACNKLIFLLYGAKIDSKLRFMWATVCIVIWYLMSFFFCLQQENLNIIRFFFYCLYINIVLVCYVIGITGKSGIGIKLHFHWFFFSVCEFSFYSWLFLKYK